MNFLIIGGDERLVCLAKMLVDAGHGVRCFALEKAKLPEGAKMSKKVESADCVVLPLPAEGRISGTLNAPFAEKTHDLSEILSKLAPGTLVCGGKISPKLRNAGAHLRLRDVMTRPEFTVGNANVTAEGAVSLLTENLSSTIFDTNVLVVGYGRIGRLLAHKLKGLDAKTTVMSKNVESRALAEGMGLHAMKPTDTALYAAFDAVINTAPAAVIPTLEGFKKSCLMLELASAPGIDKADAERMGLRYLAAPGLPGRYAPESAARLVFNAVMSIIREEGHE